MADIEALYAALRKGLVNIVFQKVNGTKRIMTATLNQEYLPPRKESEDADASKASRSTNVVVWDVEKKGWRSMRPELIESFKEIA